MCQVVFLVRAARCDWYVFKNRCADLVLQWLNGIKIHEWVRFFGVSSSQRGCGAGWTHREWRHSGKFEEDFI